MDGTSGRRGLRARRLRRVSTILIVAAGGLLVLSIVLAASGPDLARVAGPLRLAVPTVMVMGGVARMRADPVRDGIDDLVDSLDGTPADDGMLALEWAASREVRIRMAVFALTAAGGLAAVLVGAVHPAAFGPTWVAPVLIHGGCVALAIGIGGVLISAAERVPLP